MKINIDKTKEMITIFANLSEESQDTLLAEAYKLEINQNIEKQVIKSGKPATKENIDKSIGRFLDVVGPIMEHWDDMSPNHRAVLAMKLNELSNGELAKEEYVDFVVRTRQLSISEYIEKYIPGADIDEVKRIYRSLE